MTRLNFAHFTQRFSDAESSKVLGTAAEYVFARRDGRIVMVTDETMGFGFLTYSNEFGGPIETTEKPVTTTSKDVTTKDPVTDNTGRSSDGRTISRLYV